MQARRHLCKVKIPIIWSLRSLRLRSHVSKFYALNCGGRVESLQEVGDDYWLNTYVDTLRHLHSCLTGLETKRARSRLLRFRAINAKFSAPTYVKFVPLI